MSRNTSSSSSNERLLSVLLEAGYSSTRPRRVIVTVLAEATQGLTPLEILAHARREHPQLGLGTVYRTLDLLASLNLVRRVHREDGCHAYLPASAGHHHAVICQGCGYAIEFPGGDHLDTLIEQVEVSTGFIVDDHLLQLFGRCPECIQKER